MMNRRAFVTLPPPPARSSSASARRKRRHESLQVSVTFPWRLSSNEVKMKTTELDRPVSVRVTSMVGSVFTFIELLLLVTTMVLPLRAAPPQAGSVDLAFDAGEVGAYGVPNTGQNTVVEDFALLPDGRIYIGGHFGWVQDVPRDGIARLLPNGLLDATFRE